MSTLECTELLGRVRLGRLACSIDARPYVVSFYFAHADNRLYAFSLPGKKIEIMRSNPQVCVLVEEYDTERKWRSVVVDGHFEELPNRTGPDPTTDHAWSLLSKHTAWWEPGALKPDAATGESTSKPVFFAIRIDAVSGRDAHEE